MVITVALGQAGQRIDAFSACLEPIATRTIAQKLIAGGHVTIGGNAVAKSYKVAEGDVIHYNLPEPKPSETIPEDIPLDIVYEDDALIVVNKPKGLVVHPAAGNWDGTLVNALLHHCKLSGIGGVLRPGIVHRLDKDTSGIMVVAKNDIAHQGLAAQLADRSMLRVYHALCCGVVAQDKIRINAPIARHPVNRKKMAVPSAFDYQNARDATTYVEVLERFAKHTLVSARLETGRTHQIRVHMAYVKHPVLGDTVYGSAGQADFSNETGQVLHAKKLGFVHPVTGVYMELDTPLPEYFTTIVNRLIQKPI